MKQKSNFFKILIISLVFVLSPIYFSFAQDPNNPSPQIFASPEVSPPHAPYTSTQTITFTYPDPINYDLMYTTNGTIPSCTFPGNGSFYDNTGPFYLNVTTTVKAKLCSIVYQDTPVQPFTYTFEPSDNVGIIAEPAQNPQQPYTEPFEVTLTQVPDTIFNIIVYTLDGSDPVCAYQDPTGVVHPNVGLTYSSANPIQITEDTMIRARICSSNYNVNTNVFVFNYTLGIEGDGEEDGEDNDPLTIPITPTFTIPNNPNSIINTAPPSIQGPNTISSDSSDSGSSSAFAGLVPCGTERDPIINDPTGHSIGGDISNPCDFNMLIKLINNIVNFILFYLAIPIAALMFVYAGFLLITSGGSSEKKTKAKNIFVNVIIGIVFAVGAWLIIHTVLSLLGYDGSWIGL